jgi:hypothetical protein
MGLQERDYMRHIPNKPKAKKTSKNIKAFEKHFEKKRNLKTLLIMATVITIGLIMLTIKK